MHDLQDDAFADMVAQTVTYGAFSAAVQSGEIALERLPDFIPRHQPIPQGHAAHADPAGSKECG